MKFFTRTNRMSNIMLVLSVLFFCLSIYGILHLELKFMFNNEPIWSFLSIIYIIIFLISFLMGIALKCIVKDAQEDLKILEN
jgi:hypothetical protein